MLFAAGAVGRLGRVDDGSTVTDFDDEAIARKHTLAASLALAEWQQAKIIAAAKSLRAHEAAE